MPDFFDEPNQGTIIKVVGVGGAGGNAVLHMITKGVGGVEFIAANTDRQALEKLRGTKVIQLGETGLGAGMKPEVAEKLALSSYEDIKAALAGAHMVFIAAGMGGGTGTGAGPIVAKAAKELGALTVAVVSKPFSYEGSKCMKAADLGIERMSEHVDSIIVILNEKLEDIYEDASMIEWFAHADNVLKNAVAGIAEIINIPGHINVDFNDVKTIMGEQGKAMMGTAVAEGEDRARIAAEQAIASPLLEGIDLSGARGVLVNITASSATLKGREVKEVMKTVRAFAAEDATIVQGAAYEENMGDLLRVTVVATGLGRKPLVREIPSRHAEVREGLTGQQPRNPMPVSRANTGQDNKPASVWRRPDANQAVQAMEEQGKEMYDIPAYLRKQVP